MLSSVAHHTHARMQARTRKHIYVMAQITHSYTNSTPHKKCRLTCVPSVLESLLLASPPPPPPPPPYGSHTQQATVISDTTQ